MDTHHRTDSKTLVVQRPVHDQASRAFTLTELLVVLAMLGMLGLILLPALADTRPGSKAFQCVNNMRQMAEAWMLYAADNRDRLAINSDPHIHNSPVFPYPNGGQSWITGTLDWTGGSYNTNTSYLVNDAHSLLGSYLGRSAKVFACPATAIFLSPAQRALGWNQRSRSVAMNAAVGDGDKYNEPANPFGWSAWYVAKKTTDFHRPGPSGVWVFSDEHPDSMDDALLYTPSYATTVFTELPGSQHEGACGITFADGHAGIHKWQGTAVRQPVQFVVKQLVACPITDPDMLWLAQHTPQN
jgi:prepilin-type N-terminal cleavage/methylation domain-containing protein/prepilin-type processing-associated H-X9-DG protein